MKTEGTNLLLQTISRRQRSIPLGGRYRQASLYMQLKMIHCLLKLYYRKPKSPPKSVGSENTSPRME